MALTLPYPGLVFVPLDILTAEEQNEIVANYTYIANQFPVTSENLAITHFSENSSQVLACTQEYQQYLSLDVSSVPSGAKLFVTATVHFDGDGTDTGRLMYINNTYLVVQTSYWGCSTSWSGVIDRPADGQIVVDVRKDNSSMTRAVNGSLAVIVLA